MESLIAIRLSFPVGNFRAIRPKIDNPILEPTAIGVYTLVLSSEHCL